MTWLFTSQVTTRGTSGCLYSLSWGPHWSSRSPKTSQEMCVLSHFSHVWLFATLWTVACQALLFMELFRQEYWNCLPCPPPDPGIKPTSFMSPVLAGRFFTTSATWEALLTTPQPPNLYHSLSPAQPTDQGKVPYKLKQSASVLPEIWSLYWETEWKWRHWLTWKAHPNEKEPKHLLLYFRECACFCSFNSGLSIPPIIGAAQHLFPECFS